MAGKEAAGLIINAGGLSHTSVSILDSLLSINIPKIEDINLKNSSIKKPNSLDGLLSDNKLERLNHSYGKSFPDSIFKIQTPGHRLENQDARLRTIDSRH